MQIKDRICYFYKRENKQNFSEEVILQYRRNIPKSFFIILRLLADFMGSYFLIIHLIRHNKYLYGSPFYINFAAILKLVKEIDRKTYCS